MRNTKAILAGTLMAPVLALTGGIAYASTTSHPAPTQATVTATTQHPVGEMRVNWCDWRYTGHRCDRHNYGHQARTIHQRSHYAAHRHHGYRHHYCYQHRDGYRSRGSRALGDQGWGYSYQGGPGTGGGSRWGNGGGCCR